MQTAFEIEDLNGLYPGVPEAEKPFCWDRKMPVPANIEAISARIHRFTRKIPAGTWFDEVAILANNERARDDLVGDLETYGWRVFNRSADVVYNNPMSTRYAVEYVFLNHPTIPWRFEVMLLGTPALVGGSGFSPLHQSLWPEGRTPLGEVGRFPIPHLSFKPDRKDVEAIGASKAVRRVLNQMNGRGFIIAQACQSTYGEFWYLRDNEAVEQLYLKPRINNRDA